jgi:hypothetical protein
MKQQKDYWRMEGDKQIYYINNAPVGEFHTTLGWFMSHKNINKSMAVKELQKLNRYEPDLYLGGTMNNVSNENTKIILIFLTFIVVVYFVVPMLLLQVR